MTICNHKHAGLTDHLQLKNSFIFWAQCENNGSDDTVIVIYADNILDNEYLFANLLKLPMSRKQEIMLYLGSITDKQRNIRATDPLQVYATPTVRIVYLPTTEHDVEGRNIRVLFHFPVKCDRLQVIDIAESFIAMKGWSYIPEDISERIDEGIGTEGKYHKWIIKRIEKTVKGIHNA